MAAKASTPPASEKFAGGNGRFSPEEATMTNQQIAEQNARSQRQLEENAWRNKGWMTEATELAGRLGMAADITGYGQDVLTLKKGTEAYVTVAYSGQVYSQELRMDFHGHRTLMPFVVRVGSSKTVRQATVEKAINYANRELERMDMHNKGIAAANDLLQGKIDAATKALADQGIEVEHKTDWHTNMYGSRGHHGYETHRLTTKDTGLVTANADFLNPAGSRLVVTKIGMQLTPGQFKSLVQFIDELKRETEKS